MITSKQLLNFVQTTFNNAAKEIRSIDGAEVKNLSEILQLSYPAQYSQINIPDVRGKTIVNCFGEGEPQQNEGEFSANGNIRYTEIDMNVQISTPISNFGNVEALIQSFIDLVHEKETVLGEQHVFCVYKTTTPIGSYEDSELKQTTYIWNLFFNLKFISESIDSFLNETVEIKTGNVYRTFLYTSKGINDDYNDEMIHNGIDQRSKIKTYTFSFLSLSGEPYDTFKRISNDGTAYNLNTKITLRLNGGNDIEATLSDLRQIGVQSSFTVYEVALLINQNKDPNFNLTINGMSAVVERFSKLISHTSISAPVIRQNVKNVNTQRNIQIQSLTIHRSPFYDSIIVQAKAGQLTMGNFYTISTGTFFISNLVISSYSITEGDGEYPPITISFVEGFRNDA